MIFSFIQIIFLCSVFLIGYSYVLYPFILILMDKLFPAKPFQQKEILPKVSLVIAAYNEEKVIRKRIENALALDYPSNQLEIVIASDGSDDQTASIVKEYASKGVVLYDYQERRGKVNVLNETVPKSSGDIIIFSDANTNFAEDAIKKLTGYFVDQHVGCVCGRLTFVNAKGSSTGDLEGVYWRYETFLKKMEGKRGALLGANGGIFAIRKELFEFCPGDTIVEDFVMPMKILEKGFAVIYAPQAHAMEEAAQKIVQEKQRRIRIGAGDFQALFRLLPMLNPLRGFPALAFWSHKVLRWFVPFFLIITFLSNLFLLNNSFYFLFFILQCIFYMCAFIGQILSLSLEKNCKPFSLCYYFVSMNTALLLGFFRYIMQTQKVTWARTERS